MIQTLDEYYMAQQILDAMRHVYSQSNHTFMSGICSAIDRYIPEYTYARVQVVSRLFRTWPKYTGNDSFPIVGGPYAYSNALCKGTAWSRHSAYGRLRWELLEWAIKELNRWIKSYEQLNGFVCLRSE